MAKIIRFHYLYRDSGNYKQFRHKDFSNPTGLSAGEVKSMLEQYLIDGLYFYPEEAGIKKFRFHRYCDDYSWYEMEGVEETEGKSRKETIMEFINRLKGESFPG